MQSNDDAIWRRLRDLDDPVSVERPPGFDERVVADRFDRLVERLEREFACDCQVNAGFPLVQDATFYGDATIPAEATESGGAITIRVSNFGDLAVWGLGLGAYDDRETEILLAPSDRLRVESALRDLDYFVVPERLLGQTYDGPNRAWEQTFPGEPPITWWIRFFDYV